MILEKKIEGSCYTISSDGIVRSYRKSITKEMVSAKDTKGYLRVGIIINGKAVTKKVHRLVAIAFIPNPENKPQVNHINGIKDDNRVENLEWTTNKENMIHAFKTGLQRNDGMFSPCRKITEKQVHEIRNSNLKQVDLMKIYGLSASHISSIINRKTWKNI